MYAIVGLTGQVGGAAARDLLAQGAQVRGIVRDPAKAAAWAAGGVELAKADLNDAAALARAFEGVEAAYVLLPPTFDPAPGYPETQAVMATLRQALETARVRKVVALSSIGAQQAHGLGLISQLHRFEETLDDLDADLAWIRAGWFMENTAWDVAPARETGRFLSFLQPLQRPVPMIAVADVGRAAAEALVSPWSGRRVIEAAGPRAYSPLDIAQALARALGRPVEAVIAPHDGWEALFRSQGARNPGPRIEMLDGFNSGWIDFGVPGTERFTGVIPLEAAVAALVRAA
jgi:uncharacterized protein YbjT (DUF2867 family)